MNIITMASVALQVAVNIIQIALIGFGVESASGVELAVAIVGIVMTVLEYAVDCLSLSLHLANHAVVK